MFPLRRRTYFKKKIFSTGAEGRSYQESAGGREMQIFLAVTDAKKKNVPFKTENIFKKKKFFSTGAEGRSCRESAGGRKMQPSRRFFWR
jgi:hypothetical protein